MSDTVPTYGYHLSEKPRVFNLKAGESLPEGWHDSPARVTAPKPVSRKGRK